MWEGGGGKESVDLRCENISAIFESRLPGHLALCDTGSDAGGLISDPPPLLCPVPFTSVALGGEQSWNCPTHPSRPIRPSPVPLWPRCSHSKPL